VRGRIILVPVLNPSAFFAGTRESADDGVNLNRAFVDGAGKTPALAGITPLPSGERVGVRGAKVRRATGPALVRCHP